ncbi:MAG: N-acetylmuramoyl-L-alanine amidase [Clostridiales bacterium]|nr:N-acetylmuramoyl-L-alanine amidase [Clostridiales bacterium]
MKDVIITVASADAGLTPPMPFVGKRLDSRECNTLAKLALETALIRCGFDVSDRRLPLSDMQELVYQANRVQASGIAVVSCGAFGSRKSFNDVHGGTVRYAVGRHGAKSRELAEDICAKLDNIKPCQTGMCNHEWNGAVCPAVVIETGYITDFDEAKLMHDPDYARNVAEYATMGICEYFGMPYIPHSPTAYKDMHANIGMRGKRVKLIQAALCANGYAVDIDGVYGKNTDVAAKEFAINNGHDCADGVTGDLLCDMLFFPPRYTPPMSKHCGVPYIQRKLTSKLYDAPQNGMADQATVAAVNEFLTETENADAVDADGGISRRAMQLLSEMGGGRPRLF